MQYDDLTSPQGSTWGGFFCGRILSFRRCVVHVVQCANASVIAPADASKKSPAEAGLRLLKLAVGPQ